MDEEQCVDNCAGKLIRSNHRLMGAYVQLMPRMVQRRMEELESKAAENAKAAEAAAEAAASANAAPPATEALPASEIPITSPPPPQVSPLLTPSVTDLAPEVQGSLSKPAGLDFPVELNTAMSKTTAATEVKLSAATAFTPATEAVNPSVLNDAGNGPSFTAGLPPPPIAGAQIEFESAAPVFMPTSTTSISADVPVSTVAAPAASKSTESPSGQERAPELPPPSGQ